MGTLQVLVDGRPVELPPRREEIIRQLVGAELSLDTMEVGAVEFRVAQDKVSLRVTKSHPATRVLSWWQWMRARSTE